MRIRYLSTEPLASEVVLKFERSGATLSAGGTLGDLTESAERFDAVLYDATARTNECPALERLRAERPTVPVIGILDVIDSVAIVPPSLDPLVDGWIEEAILHTMPGHVVSLFYRTLEYCSGEDTDESSVIGAKPLALAPDLDRTADERLRAKNRSLESLRASLSHDLRNPLMVAREYAILARETGNDDYLDRTERAIDRATALIEGIAAIARAGRGITILVDVPIREAAIDAWDEMGGEPASLVVETDRSLRADPQLLALFLETVFERLVEHGDSDTTIRIDTDRTGFSITGGCRERSAEEYRAVRTALVGPADDDSTVTLVPTIAAAHGWKLAFDRPEDGRLRLIVGV